MSEFVIENGMLMEYLGCASTVMIPDHVREIHCATFFDCETVESIVVGAGISTLKSHTFDVEWLRKVYIPAAVTELEDHIFSYPYYEDYGVVVGGETGSAIESYCNARGIDFVATDDVADFLSTPNEILRRRLDDRIEKEREFFVDESHRGYCAELTGDTLRIFVPDGVTMERITVKNMQDKLTKRRIEKIRHIVIGDHITGLESFYHFRKLQSIWLGAHVEQLCHDCFAYDYQLATIRVDERNPFFRTMEDSVLFSYDWKTLVRYAPGRPDRFYAIPDFVEAIAPSAFHYAGNLECVKVCARIRTIGKFSFHNAYNIRHIYFEGADTMPEDWTVFAVDGDDRLYKCTMLLVVGCKQGSAVEKWCKKQGITHRIVDDDRAEAFLVLPEQKRQPIIKF